MSTIRQIEFMFNNVGELFLYFPFQRDRDMITGLKARTKSGRPNWDAFFKDLQKQNKGPITVFYCGAPALASLLKKKCENFGIQFRKEVF